MIPFSRTNHGLFAGKFYGLYIQMDWPNGYRCSSIDSFILSTNRMMGEQTVLLHLEGVGEDRERFRQITHPL